MHLSSLACRARGGERGAGPTNSQFTFQNLMVPLQGHPLWVSTKGAALSSLTGSRLSWTKLWGLIYVAAPSCWGWASCFLGVSKPLSRSFPGHWAVLICNQRLKDGTQNAYSGCPSQEWLPPCSQVQPQFPSPKISPSGRAAPLSLHCSSSERISLPDQYI